MVKTKNFMFLKFILLVCIEIALVLILFNFSAPVHTAAVMSLQPLSGSGGAAGFKISRIMNKAEVNYDLQFSADNIEVENDKIGIFSSYINRRVFIERLEVVINTISKASNLEYISPLCVNSPEKPYSSFSFFGSIFELDVDTSNVLSVMVRDFYCRLENDGERIVEVSSRRAVIDNAEFVLELAGNVEIVLQDSTMRANSVVWDIKSNLFTARGPCIIITDEGVISGRDKCSKY